MTDHPPAIDGPRLLICGWAGAGNIGDELLTAAIVAMVRGAGGVPVVASRDPGTTAAEHEVESVPWGMGARGAVATVDGVIVGPGGILQDGSSLWNLPGHLAAALAARRRGVPVAAFGVGAEPLRRRSSARLLRRALADAPVVTRDEGSSDALRAAGLHPTTAADLAFTLDLPDAPAEPNDEIIVAVGPGVKPGLVRPAARRLVAPPVAQIAAAVERLAVEQGYRVALAGFRGRRDRDVAAELRAALSVDARLVDDTVDAHVGAVAGARLVVASRYHAVVLAARAGVPAHVVSTEPKLRSLAADLGPDRATLGSWADLAAPTGQPRPAPLRSGEFAGAGEVAGAIAAFVADVGARRGDGVGG
ncbi:MAG: polysaccharide pyruvyl transferase family protein [Acidimicrobiales bacterium]|nr:polysaccharide pyruvyl transferase family protein [Acidimicrobiales bacterium]